MDRRSLALALALLGCASAAAQSAAAPNAPSATSAAVTDCASWRRFARRAAPRRGRRPLQMESGGDLPVGRRMGRRATHTGPRYRAIVVGEAHAVRNGSGPRRRPGAARADRRARFAARRLREHALRPRHPRRPQPADEGAGARSTHRGARGAGVDSSCDHCARRSQGAPVPAKRTAARAVPSPARGHVALRTAYARCREREAACRNGKNVGSRRDGLVGAHERRHAVAHGHARRRAQRAARRECLRGIARVPEPRRPHDACSRRSGARMRNSRARSGRR